MANVVYPAGGTAILTGQIDLLNDTIKAVLLDTDVYTYDDAHQYYSDISAGVVGTPAALINRTVVDGVFDAENVTFSGVAGGSIEAVAVFKDTGDPNTSPLLMYWDDSIINAPFTPDGGQLTVVWNHGPTKILAL